MTAAMTPCHYRETVTRVLSSATLPILPTTLRPAPARHADHEMDNRLLREFLGYGFG